MRSLFHARHHGDAATAEAAAEATGREPAVAIEPAFDFLSAEYRTLFERSSASAFQHPIWLDAFYRRLVPGRGATPAVVTGRDRASGALRFVLPLIRRRKSGVMLLESADLGVSDYAAPVVASDFTPSHGIADLVAEVLPSFDVLRLRPSRSETVDVWRQFLDAIPERLDFSAHATALAADYATWRARAYDPSFAKYLERKKKRFARDGGRMELLSAPAAIRQAIGEIQTLRAGRFDGDLIQQDFIRDFYAAVAIDGAAAGFARTYSLLLGDEAIGHVFGLTHAGRFHYLLIGCDYDTHGRHSPGLILYDAIIADWIAAGGGDVFDFTIGDESFKRDFGAEPKAMFELAKAPTWRGRLGRVAFDARDRLRQLRTSKGANQD